MKGSELPLGLSTLGGWGAYTKEYLNVLAPAILPYESSFPEESHNE